MTSHLEEGILHELLDGEIPSPELPPIQAHLAGCAECRARLEEARGFLSVSDRLIEVLDQPVAPPARPAATPVMVSRYPWKRNLAWAATIVAAAGIGFYGGRENGPASLADGRVTVPVAAPEQPTNPVDSAVPDTRAAAPAAAPARQNVLADRPAEQDDPQEKKEALGKVKASADESERLDQLRSRRENQPQAPAQPTPAPAAPRAQEGVGMAPPQGLERRVAATAAAPPAGQSFADALKARQSSQELTTQSGLRVQGSLAGGALIPERIELSEAVRRLGGALRLIEGLVPDHLEALGQEVRVVYPLASGELLLRLQLIDGRIAIRLTAPAGFPADSLERLKALVRE
jgi:hypothetical protein